MRGAALFLSALLALALVGAALAQSSASFRLPWDVIAGGGERSASGSYQVAGTVGQAAVSLPLAESASFRVGSGYWAGIDGPLGAYEPTPMPLPDGHRVYLPVILRASE